MCQPVMKTYTEPMKAMDSVLCMKANAGSPTAQMLHMKMAIAIATKAFAKN
jgi:hypothetical protein